MKTEGRSRIPIGVHNFAKICGGGYCYVDKTLFIKELLDTRAKVMFFTRPRRFGKTLNMNMLRTFFEKTDEDTSRYFTDKKIWEQGPKYTDEQGRYPVISVSFGNVVASSWERAYEQIKAILQDEYLRQLTKVDESVFNSWDLEDMKAFIDVDPSRVLVENALVDLSWTLHTAYGVEPIILIDECDTPMRIAWESGNLEYYNNMVGFMRNLLSPALKGNHHLSFACMSGILYVVKRGLLSGSLNNLMVEGVLDWRYDDCFGFTPDEVRELAAVYGLNEEKCDEIREWYDGYRFGDQRVFNPWSILMYLDEDCDVKTYWANTAGTGALGKLLLRTGAAFLQDLTVLLGGGTIWSEVSDSLIYPDLVEGSTAETACTLLLMSGYLTTTGQMRTRLRSREWELTIPNGELMAMYPAEILDVMADQIDVYLCRDVRDALLGGRGKEPKGAISNLLKQSASSFDLGDEKGYSMWLVLLLDARLHSFLRSGSR